MDRPLADRAQKGGVVRHPEADAASGHDADVRPKRRERFRDRRVDAAVYEPERLGDLFHDGNVGSNELIARLVDLEPIVTVER
jgi:hypothetical protein